MKKLIVAAVAGACLFLSASAAPLASADQQFKAIYMQEWTWRQAQHLDRDEDDETGIDTTMPRVDAKAARAHLAYWEGVMKRLDAVPQAKLSAAERVNYQVYRAQIAALVDEVRFREYEKPLTGDTTFWTNLSYMSGLHIKGPADGDRFLAQLADIPRYFDDQMNNMRAGLARGFTPPRVTLMGRDGTLTSVVDARAEDTVFYEPFKRLGAAVPAAEQARLRAGAVKVIDEKVKPAYAKLLKFMREEYVPHAREALDAESLPDGKAYYQSRIAKYTTTAMTADRIHQLGLAEGAKIRAEMDATMKKIGYAGTLPAFLQFLRTDPQFYAKTPEELLMRAAYIAKAFDGKSEQFFGYLPRRRFAIVPVPADMAPYYSAARGRLGFYLLNTYNLPSRPLYSLPALTLHESAPGHAFQMSVAQEQTGLPKFRLAPVASYEEGWALYCERLGSEMGIYSTPYETFGMLSYQAWRAARLVVDTGIHSKGWTRAQAQAYMHENTALSDHEIETEVDRYISWPGQALAYYLGEMAIVDARRKAEAALGPRFDIRAFHDTVLQLGPVPLPVLAARIDAFIADRGRSPYKAEY
jgi:uncharacterized protein (DUF885 family)